MRTAWIVPVTLAASLFVARPTRAQQVTWDIPDSLASKASVPEDVAHLQAVKQARRGSTVTAVHLRRQDGRLQYAYDFAAPPPDKSDTEQVAIDALTGAVLGVWRKKD